MTERSKRRTRGPDPKERGDDESVRLDLRIASELRRRIRHAAAESDIGLGAWVKQAIQEKLERAEAAGRAKRGREESKS